MDSENRSNLSLLRKYTDSHGIECANSEERKGNLSLVLQSGREKNTIEIPVNMAKEYVDIDFAQYRFLHKHCGIVSYEKGSLEVWVDLAGGNIFRRMRLFKIPLWSPASARETDPFETELISFGTSNKQGLHISIGLASREFLLMIAANVGYWHLFNKDALTGYLDEKLRGSRPLTLSVDNVNVRTFSDAEGLLRDISDSCFFMLSREFATDMELRIVQRPGRRREIKRPEKTLPMLCHRYPPEAMSFYRYGLSAGNMPLLQFLAFYQILEFFFEQYSMAETRRKVTNCLKDPSFSLYEEERVQDLIRVVRASDAVRNERDQLSATLTATIDPQTIVDWVEAEQDRSTFFRNQKLYARTSDKPLDTKKPENLVTQLADRIYDIRCKIVHSKASGTERNFILPYSEEAIHLSHDIDLIQEAAERVLIASSSELKIREKEQTYARTAFYGCIYSGRRRFYC